MRELELSIKKWEKLLKIARKEKGKTLIRMSSTEFKFGESLFVTGVYTCPLCKKYFYGPVFACYKCPIYAKTGAVSCVNTPYAKLENILLFKTPKTVTTRIIKIVENEVKFLKSLR